MLSSDDKKRIRAEEIFREEVRREVSRKKEAGILSFLNSSLGIWLLSTIVVGVFSWSYTVWKESRSHAQESQEKIRRLDTEIAGRVRFLEGYLPSVKKREDFWLALWAVDQPGDSRLSVTVFPEYHSRGLTALMWELRSNLPASESASIDKAIAASQRLATERLSRLASLQSDRNEGEVPDEERKLILGLLKSGFPNRWRAE
jgi:hypothetical protein